MCLYTHTQWDTAIKNEILWSAATWTDLEIIILSEGSQRQISCVSLTCKLKNDTNELIYERETDLQS